MHLAPLGMVFGNMRKYQSKKEDKDRESIQSGTTLTQDTNVKVANPQLDITNESQEVSPFHADDHKATIHRHAQKHNKHTSESLQCWNIWFEPGKVY